MTQPSITNDDGEPMTYDLFGYRTRPGEATIEDTLARIAQETGTASPEQWQRTVTLADQIADVLDSDLAQRNTDPGSQHVELITRKYGIDLQPDEVTLSIQYWATPEGVPWFQINTVLDLLRADGYTIMNAQNGQEVPAGATVSLHYAENYEIILPRLIELSHEAEVRTRQSNAAQPWWRRLLRRT